MILDKVTDLYKKFEVYISVVTFSFGLVVTFLTLTRVDMFMENFWIVVNLLLVAFSIFTLTFYENKAEQKLLKVVESPLAIAKLHLNKQRLHFYFILLIQFAFGGLFSTFFVFYIRSSSLSDSWFFILIIAILLVGNEIWKKHYTRLVFQISVFFVSLYLFLIFLLPVLFHRLGVDLFLLAGIISLLIILTFLWLLKKKAKEKFKSQRQSLRVSIFIIFILMNILYFTNAIPPIPLSLKDSGVYHKLVKVANDKYEVLGQPIDWRYYLRGYPVFQKRLGEPIYVLTAIFSPIKFDEEIIHQWQYYDQIEKKWIDSSKISLPIVGGRDNGYRTYSLKYSVPTGLWRVKVMTVRGQVLGKIKFRVENVTASPELITEVL